MPDISYTDNGDNTVTFIIENAEIDDIMLIDNHPYYRANSLIFHQQWYANRKHTVVFKKHPVSSEAVGDSRLDQLREYARKHFGAHEKAAGGNRFFEPENLEMEHPDIFKAKLEGAGVNVSKVDDD